MEVGQTLKCRIGLDRFTFFYQLTFHSLRRFSAWLCLCVLYASLATYTRNQSFAVSLIIPNLILFFLGILAAGWPRTIIL